jgi:hypothetical protein
MRFNKQLVWEILGAAGLVGLAVVWRVINHDTMALPNLELVTAGSLVAAAVLRRPLSLIVPLVALFMSDMLIGNSSVAWFTWSAFLLIGLGGLWLKRFDRQPKKLVLASAGTGLVAGLFFFLWTNLGVWVMGDGSFYPHTWAGLMTCYAMGLPFLRATLISGAVLTPVMMSVAVYAPRLLTLKQRAIVRA